MVFEPEGRQMSNNWLSRLTAALQYKLAGRGIAKFAQNSQKIIGSGSTKYLGNYGGGVGKQLDGMKAVPGIAGFLEYASVLYCC